MNIPKREVTMADGNGQKQLLWKIIAVAFAIILSLVGTIWAITWGTNQKVDKEQDEAIMENYKLIKNVDVFMAEQRKTNENLQKYMDEQRKYMDEQRALTNKILKEVKSN
jgi:hypothetical protein